MDWFFISAIFLGFIAGVTIHEAAHAWMGNRLGDPTAKDLGRISLNPIRHIDPLGTLIIPLIGLLSPAQSLIGWAKPTPYNPANLKDKKKDELMIALAGPFANLLLAALLTVLIYVITVIFAFTTVPMSTVAAIDNYLLYILIGNLILGFFNLLPIPPLDGSTLLKIFFQEKFPYPIYILDKIGFWVIVLSSFTPLGNIVGNYLGACIDFYLKLVRLN